MFGSRCWHLLAITSILAGIGCTRHKARHHGAPAGKSYDLAIAIDQAQLRLTETGTRFTGRVDGCASGYRASFDQTTPSLRLLDGDRGCVVKLDDLSHGEASFDLRSFPSWAPGSAGVIAGAAGGELLLRVESNVADGPITSPQAFRLVLQDVTTAGRTVVSRAPSVLSVEINEALPAGLLLTEVDVTEDELTATLGCDQPLDASGCHGQMLDGYRFALLADDGQPLGIGACMELQSAAVPPSIAMRDGEENGVYGKIITPALLTPSENGGFARNLRLVVLGALGSCKYFPLTVDDPASTDGQSAVGSCGTVVNGGTATRVRWQAALVDDLSACVSETQIAECHDGVLGEFSGSFEFDACRERPRVPVLTDLRKIDALRQLSDAGIAFAGATVVSALDVPYGFVMAQDPAAGTIVTPEVQVRLTVSKGDIGTTDVNDNGMRDDIELYIARVYTDQRERDAVARMASVTSRWSTLTLTAEEAVALQREDQDAFVCLTTIFSDAALQHKVDLEKAVMNTSERFLRYLANKEILDSVDPATIPSPAPCT